MGILLFAAKQNQNTKTKHNQMKKIRKKQMKTSLSLAAKFTKMGGNVKYMINQSEKHQSPFCCLYILDYTMDILESEILLLKKVIIFSALTSA